jgi:hypothetical protein
MKTFSITMISVMAMGGLAFAQVKAGGSASAGATVKTGAATGAVGGAAKGATGAATGAAKAGTGAAANTGVAGGATASAGAGMKMEMPKPPAEIAAMMKSMGSNLKCTGTFSAMGTDMPLKGTMTAKSDLDGWWVHDSYKATVTGPDKKPQTFKMEGYGTYDATAKKYRRVAVMNDGGLMVSSSDGPDASGHMTGMADTYGPHGQGMMKETMDMSDPKAGVKMTGEMSMDKGKTWTKVYEVTCK